MEPIVSWKPPDSIDKNGWKKKITLCCLTAVWTRFLGFVFI